MLDISRYESLMQGSTLVAAQYNDILRQVRNANLKIYKFAKQRFSNDVFAAHKAFIENDVPENLRCAFVIVRKYEQELFLHHFKQSFSVAKSFIKCPNQIEGYMDEAIDATRRAILTYRLDNLLSTHVGNVVLNAMIDYQRHCMRLSREPVLATMPDGIAIVDDNKKTNKNYDEIMEMLEVVEISPLSRLQRVIIDEYMHGTISTLRLTNPNTGKFYSKTALFNELNKAISIIRQTYRERSLEVAA